VVSDLCIMESEVESYLFIDCCRYVAKIMIPSGTKDVQVGMELCIIVSSDRYCGKWLLEMPKIYRVSWLYSR